jgi:prophage regulatory protein
MPEQSVETILRWRAVSSRTGLSRPTIWRLVRAGRFPKPVELSSAQAVGWVASEVEAWVQARIELRDQRESRSVPKSPGRPRKAVAATTHQRMP